MGARLWADMEALGVVDPSGSNNFVGRIDLMEKESNGKMLGKKKKQNRCQIIKGSLNIRGGCNSLKRRRINYLISKGNADVFLLQETKLSYLQECIIKSFWCSSEIGYSFSNLSGMLGGIITLWKKGTVGVDSSFKGDGYLGIKILWKDISYYIVNIYSSCELSKKIILWSRCLMMVNGLLEGILML